MRSLGHALDLIHSSRRRFRSARVGGRTDDTAWRLWWAGDAHFRLEYGREGEGSISVRAGPVWWMLDERGEAYTNDGDTGLRLGMRPELGLLHTRSLLASAVLEVVREDRVAGRPAVVLRATPRPGGHHWRWWGFWGSTEPIEVPIDLERGVALGGPHLWIEEIAFDQEFPPEVFSRPYPEDLPGYTGGSSGPGRYRSRRHAGAWTSPSISPLRSPRGRASSGASSIPPIRPDG